MLATLNLQLSSVELLDDTNLTPVSPAPGDMGDAESGFADLLRLRVDASLVSEEAGGELLPQGGSELPSMAELVSPDTLPGSRPKPGNDPLLWKPKLSPGLIKLSPVFPGDGEPGIADDAAGLLLETPVNYPMSDSEGAVNPDALILAPPVIADTALATTAMEDAFRLEPGSDRRRGIAIDPRLRLEGGPSGRLPGPVPTPVIDGREARAVEPAGRTAPIVVSDSLFDIQKKAPLADIIKRPYPTLPMPVDGRAEPGIETPQPRIAVQPVTQNLQAQINPQPAQPVASLPPAVSISPASVADPGYVATLQQSTDLISTSVRDSAWGQQVGDRVVMMAANQLKQVEIRLTPAELGPLRVQVSVDDGAAHVTFHAQHAVTRDALEQALPRLREMLAENGLSLGQADVSDRGVGEGSRDSGSDARSSNALAEDSPDAASEIDREALRRPASSNGLVDTFV